MTHDTMEIAKIIIQQLGGQGRLMAMIGAKNFIAGNNYVMFKFSLCKRFNYIRITLNCKDLYDIKLYKLVKYNPKNMMEIHDVSCDKLKSIIEQYTGLNLSL